MKSFNPQKLPLSEIDYNYLMACLQDYQRPRDKISELLKQGILLRVKKGLYVPGPKLDLSFSKAVLANLIYGPSYISSDYALSFYGLIPEAVSVVTSITPQRNKYFATPVGDFSYQYLPPDKYAVGIQLRALNSQQNILIASPEKALVDKIWRHQEIKTTAQLQQFLQQGLRIEKVSLKKMRLSALKKIKGVFQKSIVDLLYQYLQEIKRESL